MGQAQRIAAQRNVVIEQLRANSSELIFELLADILSIEREHRDHPHGVKEAIRATIDRVAEYDIPEEDGDNNEN
ncbi:hypothetical protein ACFLWV_04145 [Chloroflexota bacterium]